MLSKWKQLQQKKRIMDDTAKHLKQIENKISLIQNRQAAAERKKRTHRLVQIGAAFESVFPNVAPDGALVMFEKMKEMM